MHLRAFIEKIDWLTNNYYISFNNEDSNYKLESYRFSRTYSINIKSQVIEKIFLNNFEKVYVRANFKNKPEMNRKVNNSIFFELNLYTDKNSVKVKSCKAIMYLKNIEFEALMNYFFEENKIDFTINVVEKDLQEINNLNFRKAIKIHKLDSYNLNENVKYKFDCGGSKVDLINSIYNNESEYELKFHYMLFGSYLEFRKELFSIGNYKNVIEKIKNEMTSVNKIIEKEYKKERKLFTMFKYKDFVFMETINMVNNLENTLELLPEFKKINMENKNKEQLYEKFMFLKQLINKYDGKSKDEDYLDLIDGIMIHSNKFVELVRTNKDQMKYGENAHYYRFDRYLKFNFEKFHIYLNISRRSNYRFEIIKESNLIFNLMEKLLNDDLMDFIQKLYFKIN